MRDADAATIATLAGAGIIRRCDLYTITLMNGTVLRLTSADYNQTIGGHLFISGMAISRTFTKQSVGTSVDQVQVTFYDAGVTTVNGVPIIVQFRLGLFKRAHVLIQKMFLDDWADLTRDPIDWFEGRISDIPTVAAMTVTFNVKSLFDALSQQMPMYVYQPSCVDTLYDAGCGLDKTTFTFAYAAASGSTSTVFNLTGTAKADGYYALGKMSFSTGPNAGQPARTIKSYISGVATVFNPFPFTPGVGDVCALVAGCDKTQAVCTSRFTNSGLFRGYRFIPVPETAFVGGSGVAGGVASPGGTGGLSIGSAFSAGIAGQTYVA